MTDAHYHVSCGDSSVRALLIGRDFFGVHPWETLEECKVESVKCKVEGELRSKLLANPAAGVGEIGLDRLKVRDIPPLMREVFEAQLMLALELNRPVVLHGAKCWGQVVATIRKLTTHDSQLTAFLFHGFSRSDGLIPDIVKLNGFISVGPAVLNDHAVNYRALVKKIPLDRLLVETDAVVEARVPTRPHIREVLEKTAKILGVSSAELERITDENADRFLGVV